MRMMNRKKTYLLPQKLINEMKRIFRTRTETAAIISAMEEMALRKRMVDWHRKNAGRLRIRDLYGR